MENLPEKWGIRRNKETDIIITDYINEISKFNHLYYENNRACPFLHNGIGIRSGGKLFMDYTEISFDDFQRLVLNKSTEPQYEIY